MNDIILLWNEGKIVSVMMPIATLRDWSDDEAVFRDMVEILGGMAECVPPEMGEKLKAAGLYIALVRTRDIVDSLNASDQR